MDARLLPLPPPAVETESDAAIFQRAQRGDRAAFTAFYARHAEGIVGYFRLRLWRHAWEDADDLAADVWARVWAKRAQYRPQAGSQPKDWLFTIAAHRWYDWCRRTPNREPPEPLERRLRAAGSEPAAPPGEAPEAEVVAALNAAAVRAALAGLTHPQRRVIRLRWLRDYSIADAARYLGATEESVKQLQVRAFRHLRADLAAYAPDAS